MTQNLYFYLLLLLHLLWSGWRIFPWVAGTWNNTRGERCAVCVHGCCCALCSAGGCTSKSDRVLYRIAAIDLDLCIIWYFLAILSKIAEFKIVEAVNLYLTAVSSSKIDSAGGLDLLTVSLHWPGTPAQSAGCQQYVMLGTSHICLLNHMEPQIAPHVPNGGTAHSQHVARAHEHTTTSKKWNHRGELSQTHPVGVTYTAFFHKIKIHERSIIGISEYRPMKSGKKLVDFKI